MSRARVQRKPSAGGLAARRSPARLPAAKLPPIELPRGKRLACAASTYHAEVVHEMLASALDTLATAGIEREAVLVVSVPGAFELPIVARRLCARADIAAVLCFGLVLKGETEHDMHIAQACAQGLMRVALESDTPVLFGVLTCATLAQARARARWASRGGLDKGHEVASAALAVLAALAQAGGA